MKRKMLKLKRETLRTMSEPELRQAVGGLPTGFGCTFWTGPDGACTSFESCAWSCINVSCTGVPPV